MEPEKENFRCYIFTRMKLADCHENPPGIGICVWNIFLFIWHCCRWVRRFQSGKKDLRNEPRSRAPNTVMNENTIGYSLYFLTMLDPWWWTCCQRRQQYTTQEQYVLPNIVATVQEKRLKRGNYKNTVTPWQCCSRRSKGRNSVSGGRKVTSPAGHPPCSPDLKHRVTLGCFPLWKLALLERTFCGTKSLQERRIHNLTSYPFWSTTTPSRNG